jgi:hypothetical protein
MKRDSRLYPETYKEIQELEPILQECWKQEHTGHTFHSGTIEYLFVERMWLLITMTSRGPLQVYFNAWEMHDGTYKVERI